MDSYGLDHLDVSKQCDRRGKWHHHNIIEQLDVNEECEDEEEEENEEIEWQQILDLKGYLSDEIETVTLETIDEDVNNATTSSDDKHVTVPEASSNHGNTVTRMALNDHKAGMEGLDKEKINKIIHDASKGSKYYENEVRKEQKVTERIEAMKMELKHFTDDEKKKAFNESNKVIKDLGKYVDLTRTLVHVDMDAFYAAVETRDNPKFKDIPMAVGGNAMLCTSNYAARKYGVRAAMPGFIAKKLCPQLVIVPTHFDKYKAVSAEVQEIFREYDPNFSPLSLDEAHLDLTDYMSENFMKYDYDDENKDLSEIILQEMRTKIFEKTQLTASAGIACNMMLAKICSDMNKPNGQYYLKPDVDVIKKFIKDLPIRKICGIGRVTEQMLKGLNIEKCNDLLEKRAILYLLFSHDSFRYFMKVALGISSNRITHGERKSMSAERTFQDVSNKEKLLEICYDICKHLEEDLKKENLKGYNVTLKYKLSSFVTKTRSKTVSYPVCKTEELYKLSKGLLLKEIQSCSTNKFELRLMGIRVCNFETKATWKQHTMETLFTSKVHMAEEEGVTTANTPVNEYEQSQSSIGLLKDSKEVQNNNISNKHDEIKSRMSGQSIVECPICRQPQQNNELTLNVHIDSCLKLHTTEPGQSQANTEVLKDSETVVVNYTTSHEYETKNILSHGECDLASVDCDLDTVECPVCGQPQKNEEITLNIHIDNCLTKKAIVEIIREQETHGNCSNLIQDTNKKQMDNNGSLAVNTDNTNRNKQSSSPSLKRKKNELVGGKKKRKVTLHNFWEKK